MITWSLSCWQRLLASHSTSSTVPTVEGSGDKGHIRWSTKGCDGPVLWGVRIYCVVMLAVNDDLVIERVMTNKVSPTGIGSEG